LKPPPFDETSARDALAHQKLGLDFLLDPLCDQHQNRRRAAVCPSRNDALSCHDQPDGIESVHSLVR
jgi:hypothetical protein